MSKLPVGVEGTSILVILYVLAYFILNQARGYIHPLTKTQALLYKSLIVMWILLLLYWGSYFNELHPLDTWARYVGIFLGLVPFFFSFIFLLWAWEDISIRSGKKNKDKDKDE